MILVIDGQEYLDEAEARRLGALPPEPAADLLARIGEVSAEHAAVVEHANWLDMQRRHLIKAALRSGRSAVEVAEAAGISRARVYQIRDGRR